jgi:hypothetical protein
MNILHTYDMNYQRMTISVPNHIYEDVLMMFGKGNISSLVSEALEEKILSKKLEPKDSVEAFFANKKNLPKLSDDEIMEAIKKGRM